MRKHAQLPGGPVPGGPVGPKYIKINILVNINCTKTKTSKRCLSKNKVFS